MRINDWTSESEARRQGERAYQRDRYGRDDNPYREHDGYEEERRHRAWDAGFQAEKRRDEQRREEREEEERREQRRAEEIRREREMEEYEMTPEPDEQQPSKPQPPEPQPDTGFNPRPRAGGD